MKTRIKICGLTRLEDARFCAAAGADYLGFVLARHSPRFVDPVAAKEIVGWVYGPLSVGVFVDEEPETVNRVVREVGFDLVQLHGSETVDICRAIEAPVIKALHVGPETRGEDLGAAIEKYQGTVQHILFDTSVGGESGGTGKTFDWEIVAGLIDPQTAFVAGGIGPENACDVIARLTPFALDVSSGVEAAPGIKSFEKVTALLDAVAATRNGASPP